LILEWVICLLKWLIEKTRCFDVEVNMFRFLLCKWKR
jgi:hypothetical protein